MKASEFIEHLRSLVEKNGDLDIMIFDTNNLTQTRPNLAIQNDLQKYIKHCDGTNRILIMY